MSSVEGSGLRRGHDCPHELEKEKPCQDGASCASDTNVLNKACEVIDIEGGWLKPSWEN
jgi:hypothetical protein